MKNAGKFQVVPNEHEAFRPMLDQLNIALLNRLGGHIVMDAAEVDATGQWDMIIALDPENMKYEFRLVRSSDTPS